MKSETGSIGQGKKGLVMPGFEHYTLLVIDEAVKYVHIDADTQLCARRSK